MYVSNLYLKNFRNYDELNIKLNESLNIIIGDNAQGKTNLLESIYFSCFGKSFRTKKDKELINIDSLFNHVKLNVIKKHTDIDVEYRIHREYNKEIKINNNSIRKLSNILGNIYVVLFSPEDLDLVKGSPGNRRNFINRELSNLYPKYCSDLIEYKKIIKQRNKLLKRFQQKDKVMLDIFTDQLIDKGTKIIIERIKFINEINLISNRIHKKLTNNQENLEIDYNPNIDLKNDENYDIIKTNFIKKVAKNRKREIKMGYTLVGPHRDDFSMFINEKNINMYGSQGQQRTAALSLKLSEIDLIKNETNEYPILLLDDVFSELDIKRQSSLLKIFKETQTVITSTHIDDILVDKINNDNIIVVKNGKVIKEVNNE